MLSFLCLGSHDVFTAVYLCATGVSYLSLSSESAVPDPRLQPEQYLDCPRTLAGFQKAALRCCANVSACFPEPLCFKPVPQRSKADA